MMDLKKWMYNKKSIQFKSKNSKSSKHNKSHSIAFLVDGRNDRDLSIIKNYIHKLQSFHKDVSLLFMTDHSNPEQISFQAFNKKGFTWYHIPKSPVLVDFIHKSFDLLICFNVKDVKELNIIADLSNALFKVGVANKEMEFFDLIIDPVHEKTCEDYINVLDKTFDQLSMDHASA